jgi:hypothetical protein
MTQARRDDQILETPKGDDPVKQDRKMLRRLRMCPEPRSGQLPPRGMPVNPGIPETFDRAVRQWEYDGSGEFVRET